MPEDDPAPNRDAGPKTVLDGVFGFNRTGQEIRERCSEVVELLEASSRVARRDERLVSPG